MMTDDDDSNGLELLPLSIYLVINECGERWLLNLYKNGIKREFLFSDTPWGDVCATDIQDDLERIENAKNIIESDLVFMETLFKTDRSEFQSYLHMGKVYAFLKAVGIPEFEMECDWMFNYPKEGTNRCLLWNEFFKLGG